MANSPKISCAFWFLKCSSYNIKIIHDTSCVLLTLWETERERASRFFYMKFTLKCRFSIWPLCQKALWYIHIYCCTHSTIYIGELGAGDYCSSKPSSSRNGIIMHHHYSMLLCGSHSGRSSSTKQAKRPSEHSAHWSETPNDMCHPTWADGFYNVEQNYDDRPSATLLLFLLHIITCDFSPIYLEVELKKFFGLCYFRGFSKDGFRKWFWVIGWMQFEQVFSSFFAKFLPFFDDFSNVQKVFEFPYCYVLYRFTP